MANNQVAEKIDCEVDEKKLIDEKVKELLILQKSVSRKIEKILEKLKTLPIDLNLNS